MDSTQHLFSLSVWNSKCSRTTTLTRFHSFLKIAKYETIFVQNTHNIQPKHHRRPLVRYTSTQTHPIFAQITTHIQTKYSEILSKQTQHQPKTPPTSTINLQTFAQNTTHIHTKLSDICAKHNRHQRKTPSKSTNSSMPKPHNASRHKTG